MAEDNGTAPVPAEAETPAAGGQASAADRLMGLFGLAVAIGIALIAVDLITGGAVSRLLPAREPDGDG